jgi:hypothetical protein
MIPVQKHHKVFCRRDFINKEFHHSDGSIYSEVEMWEYEKDGVDMGVTLKIRDCERPIHLSLSCTDDEGISNSLYKLDTIIQHLSDLKLGLVKAYEIYKNLREKQINEQKEQPNTV